MFPRSLDAEARGALHTNPSHNQLTLPHQPPAHRSRRRPRKFVPIQVLDPAAAVADEVMMLKALGIKPTKQIPQGLVELAQQESLELAEPEPPELVDSPNLP